MEILLDKRNQAMDARRYHMIIVCIVVISVQLNGKGSRSGALETVADVVEIGFVDVNGSCRPQPWGRVHKRSPRVADGAQSQRKRRCGEIQAKDTIWKPLCFHLWETKEKDVGCDVIRKSGNEVVETVPPGSKGAMLFMELHQPRVNEFYFRFDLFHFRAKRTLRAIGVVVARSVPGSQMRDICVITTGRGYDRHLICNEFVNKGVMLGECTYDPRVIRSTAGLRSVEARSEGVFLDTTTTTQSARPSLTVATVTSGPGENAS